MSLISWGAHTLPDWIGLGQSIAAQCLAWLMHSWVECQISSTRQSWTKTNFLMEPEVATQAEMSSALDRNHKKLFWAEQFTLQPRPQPWNRDGVELNLCSQLSGWSFFFKIKICSFCHFLPGGGAGSYWLKSEHSWAHRLFICSLWTPLALDRV